jgi:hypothetical protein
MQMFCVPSAHLNKAYLHSLMGIQAATEHNIACTKGGITSKELQVLTNVKSTQIATHEHEQQNRANAINHYSI